MVKKKQVIQSGAWQLLNVSVKVFSQFAYFAVMARLLSKAELGIFAILNSFMNFGNMLGDGGMGDALVQRKEIEKQHINAAFYMSNILAVVIYAVIFFAAPWIADFYKEPDLTYSLRVLSLIFVFAAMYAPSFAILQRRFAFKKIFIADGVTLLISNVVGIILAFYGFGVMSLVYSQLVNFGGELIVLLYYVNIPLKLGFKKQHWKDLAGYGSGLTLIRFNTYIVNFGIILEVGKLVSASVLGVFDRSFRIMNIPQRFLYDMVHRVTMPAMVKKNDGGKGTFGVFLKTLTLTNSGLVPLTVFLILFSKPIVLIFLGKKWLDAVPLLQIFFLNLPMRTTSSLADTLIRVHGFIRLNLIRKVQGSIFIVGLIYIGYLCRGFFINGGTEAGDGTVAEIYGMGWAIFISTVISYVMMMFIIRKRIFPDDWKKIVFKPYYNGARLSVLIVIPFFGLYYLLNTFLKDDIISFSIISVLMGSLAAFLFIKKPAVLGSDVAYIQEDLLSMFKKKKKKKQQQDEAVVFIDVDGVDKEVD